MDVTKLAGNADHFLSPTTMSLNGYKYTFNQYSLDDSKKAAKLHKNSNIPAGFMVLSLTGSQVLLTLQASLHRIPI